MKGQEDMNEAQLEAIAQANAYLTNAGLAPYSPQPVLQVKLKSVYGNQTIYPDNEAAEYFAAIAGTKTLSAKAVTYAAKLGFKVVQAEAYSLAGVM